MTKPPTCCDRCRGKPSSVRASVSTLATAPGSSGSRPASRTRVSSMLRAVPPLHRARERRDLQRVEAHRLRHVAQRAARPVADDRRGQRGALAAVLRVDVLDDFLAPLVLEIDVDVRRLVALPGDEALEQQRHARGIDFGDAEAEADGGVGRRAATLAEDVPRAREAHDVVHGEEIGLVVELGDQREFVLDRLPRRRGHAFRPALHRALLREPPQPARRRVTFRHDLARVLVAQFVERERAARGDLDRRREQFGRMQLRDALDRAQVPLAVRKQRQPRLLDRRADARRGQHVLQRAAAARVHVHVARPRPAAGRVRGRGAATARAACGRGPSSAVRPRSRAGRGTAWRASVLRRRPVALAGSHRQSRGVRGQGSGVSEEAALPAIPTDPQPRSLSPAAISSKSPRHSRYSPFGAARRPRVISRQSRP